MKIILDLEKESIQELEKAISILTRVKNNKEQGLPFSQGLEQIANIPKQPQTTSRAAQSALNQEKIMQKIDMSKIYSGQ